MFRVLLYARAVAGTRLQSCVLIAASSQGWHATLSDSYCGTGDTLLYVRAVAGTHLQSCVLTASPQCWRAMLGDSCRVGRAESGESHLAVGVGQRDAGGERVRGEGRGVDPHLSVGPCRPEYELEVVQWTSQLLVQFDHPVLRQRVSVVT